MRRAAMKKNYRDIMDRVRLTDAMRDEVKKKVFVEARSSSPLPQKHQERHRTRPWARGLVAAVSVCACAAACLVVLPSLLRHPPAQPVRNLVSGEATAHSAGGSGTESVPDHADALENRQSTLPVVTEGSIEELADEGAAHSTSVPSEHAATADVGNPGTRAPNGANGGTGFRPGGAASGGAPAAQQPVDVPAPDPEVSGGTVPVHLEGTGPAGSHESVPEPSNASVTIGESPGTSTSSVHSTEPPVIAVGASQMPEQFETPSVVSMGVDVMPASLEVPSSERPSPEDDPASPSTVMTSVPEAAPEPPAEPSEPVAAPSPVPAPSPDLQTPAADSSGSD